MCGTKCNNSTYIIFSYLLLLGQQITTEPTVDVISTTVAPEQHIGEESTILPSITASPVTTSTPTKAPTTTSVPVDTSLFYVDWNEGLFGMCVQNCDGQPPCGGINTRQGQKFFATAQQCCEEELPGESLSDCTNADISHIPVDNNTPSTNPTNNPSANPTNNPSAKPTNNSTPNPITPPTEKPVTTLATVIQDIQVSHFALLLLPPSFVSSFSTTCTVVGKDNHRFRQ